VDAEAWMARHSLPGCGQQEQCVAAHGAVDVCSLSFLDLAILTDASRELFVALRPGGIFEVPIIYRQASGQSRVGNLWADRLWPCGASFCVLRREGKRICPVAARNSR
jgi:hypothetical protein